MTEWFCMECGKVIFFPSVDPETRETVCANCRKPALLEIPEGQYKTKKVTRKMRKVAI